MFSEQGGGGNSSEPGAHRPVPLGTIGARGALITGVSQGMGLILRMTGLAILARLVAPSIFGVVAIVSSISLFLSSIALMGLGMAAVREATVSENTRSALFWLQSGVGLVLGVAMASCATPISALYHNPSMRGIVLWLSLMPILNGMKAQYMSDLSRRLKMMTIAVAEILSLIIGVGLAIFVAIRGHALAAVLTQLIVPQITILVLFGLFTRWLPSCRFRFDDDVHRLISTGGHILFMNTTRNVARSALVPIIGYFLPAGPVGLYDRSQQIVVTPIGALIEQMQRITVPVFSRIRNDSVRSTRFLEAAQSFITLVPATLFLVGAALAAPLVELVLGSQWAGAAPIFAALCCSGCFRMLGQSMDWIFLSASNTRSGVMFSLWSQPAIVLLSIVGLPWGATGVAAANAGAYALYWPLSALFAQRISGVSVVRSFRTDIVILATYSGPVVLCTLATSAASSGLGLASRIFVSIGSAVLLAALLVLASPHLRSIRSTVIHLVAVMLGGRVLRLP